METLLTPQQVAERLQVKRAFVYELIRGGKLPALRLSRKALRVPESALTAYLAQRK